MREKLIRWARWGFGGGLMLASQFAQWACLFMMVVTIFIGGTALFAGNWSALGTSALALLLWGLGALVAGIIHHWSVHLLP